MWLTTTLETNIWIILSLKGYVDRRCDEDVSARTVALAAAAEPNAMHDCIIFAKSPPVPYSWLCYIWCIVYVLCLAGEPSALSFFVTVVNVPFICMELNYSTRCYSSLHIMRISPMCLVDLKTYKSLAE